ncbi:hypothetical protein [Alteromonas facilis]|uniref:hypothetical protein n=1 Tax=Alteromonas facilis TaxID=2048004 RepID=UPI000C28CCEC|nr:hypothetical protein [Alteromonas facilis]
MQKETLSMNLYLVIFQRGNDKVTQFVVSEKESYIRRYVEQHKPDVSILGILSGIKHARGISTIQKSMLKPVEKKEVSKDKAFVIVGGLNTLRPKPRSHNE